MTIVDPCDADVTIELLVKYVDQLRNDVRSIHLKTQDKTVYPVLCLWHMLEAGRLPSYEELTEDDYGNKIISDIDPASLNMSTAHWESMH
jgi:hypothetical protein